MLPAFRMGTLLPTLLLANRRAFMLSRAHYLTGVGAIESLLALVRLVLNSLDGSLARASIEVLTLGAIGVAVAPTACHGEVATLVTNELCRILRAAHLCKVFAQYELLSDTHIADDLVERIHLVTEICRVRTSSSARSHRTHQRTSATWPHGRGTPETMCLHNPHS